MLRFGALHSTRIAPPYHFVQSRIGCYRPLVNETAAEVIYLEVGDRTPGDEGSYPDDDLKAVSVDGNWRFTRKDGIPY